MARPRSLRIVYMCDECGHESPKWMGFCPSPSCGSPQPLREINQAPPVTNLTNNWLTDPETTTQLSDVNLDSEQRMTLFSPELNRVLGGGIVSGSLNLLSGEPGVGKSTLLLHICQSLTVDGKSVAYISGEESPHQIKIRSNRIGFSGERTFLISETNIDLAIDNLDNIRPALAIIDSIQTMYTEDATSGPGSVSQVRECTLRLMRWAKGRNIPIIIAGHVTKDGNVAGPRVLEHMVDTVLHLECQMSNSYRILRSSKNRFGSATEIAMFDMTEDGLAEVPDPSQTILSQRYHEAIGTALVPVMEGTTPILMEVQALTSPSYGPIPRRVANGVDYNRLLMLSAVSAKRAGLSLHNQDIIINIAGGFKITEPAADMGIIMAIASSLYNQSLGPDLAVFGEVGLSGELRQVHQSDRRIIEVSRLGLTQCILPTLLEQANPTDINLIACRTITDAINKTMKNRTNN